MCDINAAISAGVQLFMSAVGDEEPQPIRSTEAYDAGIQAAIRAAELEERKYADQKAEYDLQAGYRAKTLGAAERKLDRGEAEDVRYDSLGQRVVSDAIAAGSPEEQEAAAARATADVNAAAEATNAARARTMASLGVKPGDAAYSAGSRAGDIQKAALLSAAGTNAREGEKRRGEDLRRTTLSGRPGFSPNVPLVNAPGGTTIASTANTLGTLANAAANQENVLYNRSATNQSQIGQMIGNVLEKAGKPSPTSWPTGAFDSELFDTQGFRDGGPVAGPGGPTDDAVPAVIDGKQPAALSSGEFVVKADAVQKYGPRLMEEVNDGTAIIIPTRSPRRLSVVKGGSHGKQAA